MSNDTFNLETILDLLDITGPVTAEQKQAIADAVKAIRASRNIAKLNKDNQATETGSSSLSGEIDTEIDPELKKPSDKSNIDTSSDMDIEINDPENVLNSEKPGNEKTNTEDAEKNSNDLDKSNKGDNDSTQANEDEIEDDEIDGDEFEDEEESEEESEEAEDDNQENSNEAEESDKNNFEDDFEDEPLVNADLKGEKIQDISKKTMEINRARTISLGENALKNIPETAQNKGLLQKLAEAVSTLKNLTPEELEELSDDKLNKLFNDIIDIVQSLDDSVKTTSAEERASKIAEIKKEFSNAEVIAELDKESTEQATEEKRALRAREQEKARYSRSNFKTIADFKINFYKAIKSQVEEIEQQEQSWSVINRRHDGTDRIVRGTRNDNVRNNLIPIIDIYIDCSGSWEDADIKIGEDAVGYVLEFENKKQIKTNLYYFSNHVYTTKQPARNEGGTSAWNQILENIKANKSKNVVLLTDSDMNSQARRGPKCVVDGCVWFIWKDGNNSQEIVQHLIGKRGNYQYQFKGARHGW